MREVKRSERRRSVGRHRTQYRCATSAELTQDHGQFLTTKSWNRLSRHECPPHPTRGNHLHEPCRPPRSWASSMHPIPRGHPLLYTRISETRYSPTNRVQNLSQFDWLQISYRRTRLRLDFLMILKLFKYRNAPSQNETQPGLTGTPHRSPNWSPPCSGIAR